MASTTHDESSPIIAGQLRLARESLALSLSEAAASLGIEPTDLGRWEEGSSKPSPEQLWDLAELYGRNLDYFLRQAAPLPQRVSFRLKRRNALDELPLPAREVIVQFDEFCRFATELEELLGKPRTHDLPTYATDVDADNLAHAERNRLGLNQRPVKRLRALVEGQGVHVFEMTIPNNEFSGLSWWHSQYGPCALINAGETPGRRTFTLAHEYAHLLRRDEPSLCDLTVDVGDERFASNFAAAFLMPRTDVVEQFHLKGPTAQALTAQRLGALASRYNVSLQALSVRLEELGLVARGTTDQLVEEWEREGRYYGRPRGPRWRRRLGETYVSTALHAYREGRISLGKLARYLGLDVRKAQEAATTSGGSAP